MPSVITRALASTCVLAGLATSGLGCRDGASSASADAAAPVTSGPVTPASTEPSSDGGPTGLGNSDAGAFVPTGDPPFAFTDTPAPNLIPSAPVRGVANGQPFSAPHVLFEATRREWRVSFCERALTRPTDFVHGQALHLYVHEPIAVGKPIVHPMKSGGGYFAIRAPDATNPDGTVSWTSEHAYYLEVTQMVMKPYDPAGPLVQEAGTASGRVYVAYRGGARFLNSGLTGTFTNAVVRYYGKPFWVE